MHPSTHNLVRQNMTNMMLTLTLALALSTHNLPRQNSTKRRSHTRAATSEGSTAVCSTGAHDDTLTLDAA